MGVAGGFPFDANEELFEGFDPGGVPGVCELLAFVRHGLV